jgi:hypothetical protein
MSLAWQMQIQTQQWAAMVGGTKLTLVVFRAFPHVISLVIKLSHCPKTKKKPMSD